MYLAIDVGGTKTLLAVFSPEGKILKQNKFPTSKKYSDFLIELKKAFEHFGEPGIKACCCAVPDTSMDRKKGIVFGFGNLAWRNVPIVKDLSRILNDVPVIIENDAKLAGFFEANNIRSEFKKVLYITIGTGIGFAIIKNGIIDLEISDTGGHGMILDHDGTLEVWENYASGKALTNKYNKKASEIDDPNIWKDYVVGLAQGFNELLVTFEPDVVIVGGGVGSHFDKYSQFLTDELQKQASQGRILPPIIKAERPEEAVIYGCYDFIRQSLGNKP